MPNEIKIAIDARYIDKDGSGISNYCKNIITHISKIKGVEIYPIVNQHTPIEFQSEKIISPYSHKQHPLQELWMTFKLPEILKKKSINILFCPAFIVPLRKIPQKLITNIHDFTYIYAKETMPLKFRFYTKIFTEKALKISDKIILNSKSVQQELKENYSQYYEKTTQIYPGIPLELETGPTKTKTNKKYFLYVGNLEPRKNLHQLALIFQELRKDKNFKSHELIICGKKKWKWANIEKKINQIKENIIFKGYVKPSELKTLYQNAQAVFMISKYEGLGFPILEGLQMGKITIASNINSFKEIARNLAVFINPYNIKESSRIIKNALADKEMHENKIKKEFPQILKKFNWENCAKKTLETIKNA